MANIKLPDGQNLDMPDEIAKDDEMLRNALAPYVPDIRNAKLNRSTSAGVMTVNVVKQAGTKGAAEPSQANFEGWAIVEMMGHQREIGFVTTQAFGQAVMFRIDTPELPEREYVLERPEYASGRLVPVGSKVQRAGVAPRSRLVSPGALYAINPCTEETARNFLDRAADRPLIVVEFPKGHALSEAPHPDDEEAFGDYADGGEEEIDEGRFA